MLLSLAAVQCMNEVQQALYLGLAEMFSDDYDVLFRELCSERERGFPTPTLPRRRYPVA